MHVQVKALLSSAYERAKKLLKTHEADLHALAKELLEKETLSGHDITELLARRSGRGSNVASS